MNHKREEIIQARAFMNILISEYKSRTIFRSGDPDEEEEESGDSAGGAAG